MQYRINITSLLTVVGETLRVTLPTDRPCAASVRNGVVQVAYPYGSFALPLDKFHKHLADGSITIESVS